MADQDKPTTQTLKTQLTERYGVLLSQSQLAELRRAIDANREVAGMSHHTMQWAWLHCLLPTEKLLMRALADAASEQGIYCPSIATRASPRAQRTARQESGPDLLRADLKSRHA